MSVESIQNTAQVSEQYTIRAKREAQSAIQNQNVSSESKAAEIDTYDKENPAGVQAEGVYSVSHDDSGNLKIDYVPASGESEKSRAGSESKSSESSGGLKTEQPKSAGAAQVSDSGSDDELKELEQQKNAIQQQLNRESDENVKAQLRTQLQNIEAQIIQLKMN